MMTHYLRKPHVVAREIAGETLLVPVLQTGVNLQKVYLLNETSGAVWALLEESRSLDELVAALEEQYEAADEVMRGDVAAVLAEMAERKLIDVAETA